MHPVPLAVMDYVGPALGALLFVAGMSLVAEPTRRTLNAIILAGASGVYLSGGFGLWELIYPAIGAAIAFRGLRSYRFIGVGWLLHAGWDIAHHLWGNPIWPFMPSSAFGCMMFDSLIAPWFLAGAPSLLSARTPRCAPPVHTRQSIGQRCKADPNARDISGRTRASSRRASRPLRRTPSLGPSSTHQSRALCSV